MVERLLWVHDVVGSNPATETILRRYTMNAIKINKAMRIIAIVCFVIAAFSTFTVPYVLGLVPLGLAFWCGSTLVVPTAPSQ